MEQKQITIDFDFALYKRKDAETSLKTSLNTLFPDRPNLTAEFWKAKVRFWQEFCTLLCPEHQWDKEFKDPDVCDFDEQKRTCTVCGTVENYCDYDSPDYYARESLTKGCHNCELLSKEGGDIVPYGSTTATLPECDICNYWPFEDDNYSEEQENALYAELEEKMKQGGSTCEFWQGKLPKVKGVEKVV